MQTEDEAKTRIGHIATGLRIFLAHIGLHYTLTQTRVLARFPVVAVGIAALALVYSWLWTLLARSLSCLHCSSLLLLCLGPASASFKLYAFVTPA